MAVESNSRWSPELIKMIFFFKFKKQSDIIHTLSL